MIPCSTSATTASKSGSGFRTISSISLAGPSVHFQAMFKNCIRCGICIHHCQCQYAFRTSCCPTRCVNVVQTGSICNDSSTEIVERCFGLSLYRTTNTSHILWLILELNMQSQMGKYQYSPPRSLLPLLVSTSRLEKPAIPVRERQKSSD